VPDLDDTTLVRELRDAVTDGSLRVHYQPIVDARTGRIASVEALVRWQHPTLGLLAPGQFLPAAERADLMVEIGRHVLAQACADLADWRERWPHLALAVNVSERELLHPGFADHVIEILRAHALPAWALHLELTETVAVNEETIAAVLEPLASSGVALSIDDFGTGHSSLHRLNRLRRLQVQRLKIDKSFVDEIDPAGQGAGPLLASMIALAHSVGHSVVAEGVETSEQAAFLALHGCDELQGYLYSRPVAADQVSALLPRLSASSGLRAHV
jgi:EAL domain-containing protein (putative c-di-GMP-specific phosphodiesterase class I)